MYMDTFFSSIPLFDKLSSMGTNVCRILQSNRQGICQSLKTAVLARLKAVWLCKGQLVCTKYRQERNLSSQHLSQCTALTGGSVGRLDRR